NPARNFLFSVGYLWEKRCRLTRRVILQCLCESGRPSCVHSPKCGSDNRPIDKAAAVLILDRIRMHSRPLSTRNPKLKKSEKAHQNFHFGVLDIETQRSSQEVRG